MYLSILLSLLVPILQWHIENLKRSQRKNYRMNQGFYNERLKEFSLFDLSKRRLRADLIAVYTSAYTFRH